MKKLLSLTVIAFLSLSFISLPNKPPDSGAKLDLNNIKRISRSIYLIQHEYYDPARIKPIKMLQEGFYELAKEVPEILPRFSGNQMELFYGVDKITIDLSQIEKLYDVLVPVSEAFSFLKKHVTDKEKYDKMEFALINGLLMPLDPHSSILPPKEYEEFKMQTEGEYGGIGIVIGLRDRELTVIAPLEDGPADRIGIVANDRILQIDDQSTVNMSLNEAVDLMRGPEGTNIVLKIKSENRDPRDMSLKREKIVIKSVKSQIFTKGEKKIGVMRIKSFQEDTYADSLKAFKEFDDQGIDGLVLDLRNNPGGLLDQCILVADHILAEGDIVLTVGADNADEEIAMAKRQNTDSTYPIVVLINKGSASASEILAGALKNNNRAVILGQQSFGKGSVQSLFNIRDGSSLKLTVAQYLTPGRESIQAVGIAPDIHLYPTVVNKEFFDLIENIDFGEELLEAHLNNRDFTKKQQPKFLLTYFDETEETEKQESEYTKKIQEENDYPLHLALKILSINAAKAQTRQDILNNIGPLIGTEKLSQELKLVSKLKEKSLDWQGGQKTDRPTLTTHVEFLDETGNAVSQLTAGSNVTAKVFVKNTGTTALSRVIANLEALNPILNNREFVLGKIEAGAEKTAQVLIKIPADIIKFKENVKLHTYTEKTANSPLTTLVPTAFSEKEQPKLAYSYKIIDGSSEGTSGNQNGIPEKGEKIAIELRLKNLSSVTSAKTYINIKNKEGHYVFLKKARDTISDLKANGEAVSHLYFDIKEDFPEEDFELEFFAMDDDTKGGIVDTLNFNLKNLHADPKPMEWQVAPTVKLTSVSQNKNMLEIKGTAADDRALKDIAIFAKGRKLVYFHTNSTQHIKEKEFSATLPLEEGINIIVVQARGQRNIDASKSLSVVYHEEDNLVAKKF